MPVFVNTNGQPIEPHSLLPHWYRCLRACGIRVRGLDPTKDTFVTTALRVDGRKAWLEAQTPMAIVVVGSACAGWIAAQKGRSFGAFFLLC